VALLAGSGPDGLVALRLRPAIWTPSLECYLAELFVRRSTSTVGNRLRDPESVG
jgi:hypothetical protein